MFCVPKYFFSKRFYKMDIPPFDSQNPEPFCNALAVLPISLREQYYTRVPVEFVAMAKVIVKDRYKIKQNISRDLRLKYPSCSFESHLCHINAFI